MDTPRAWQLVPALINPKHGSSGATVSRESGTQEKGQLVLLATLSQPHPSHLCTGVYTWISPRGLDMASKPSLKYGNPSYT